MNDAEAKAQELALEVSRALHTACRGSSLLRSAIVIFDWEQLVDGDDFPGAAWINHTGPVNNPAICDIAAVIARLLRCLSGLYALVKEECRALDVRRLQLNRELTMLQDAVSQRREEFHALETTGEAAAKEAVFGPSTSCRPQDPSTGARD